MQQYITKYPHKNTDHITAKVPPFSRTVRKKHILNEFYSSANHSRDQNDFKYSQGAETVIMLVVDLSVKQQDRQYKEKTEMDQFVKSSKKNASLAGVWHFYATKY